MDANQLAASYGMTVEQYEDYVKQYYGVQQETPIDSYNPENPSGVPPPPASP